MQRVAMQRTVVMRPNDEGAEVINQYAPLLKFLLARSMVRPFRRTVFPAVSWVPCVRRIERIGFRGAKDYPLQNHSGHYLARIAQTCLYCRGLEGGISRAGQKDLLRGVVRAVWTVKGSVSLKPCFILIRGGRALLFIKKNCIAQLVKKKTCENEVRTYLSTITKST